MNNWSKKIGSFLAAAFLGLIFYSIYFFRFAQLDFSIWASKPLEFVPQTISYFFFSLFGISAYVVPLFLAYLFGIYQFNISVRNQLERIFGFCAFMCALSLYTFVEYGFALSGMLGAYLFLHLSKISGLFLIKFYAIGVATISLVLMFRFAWMQPFKIIARAFNMKLLLSAYALVKALSVLLANFVKDIALWLKKCVTGEVVDEIEEELFAFEYEQDPSISNISQDNFWVNYSEKPVTKKPYAKATKSNFTEDDFVDDEHEDVKDLSYSYTLPNLDIFTAVEDSKLNASFDKDLQFMAKVLEEKLERFGIEGKVVSIEYGPVITLFQYEPSPDCKVSKIVALEDDLALALEATSIRIIAPIPGRSVVGFEISNKNRKDVLFSAVARSEQFKSFRGHLPLVLGEDTVGHKVVVDLTTMPHLLIAGSTGSGKSVALNAMLISLLCKCSPDELKLILIDPKRLEFSSYADIPHLLFPIITQPRYAIGVLKWVVQEMESRYERMAEVGARNIFDYNSYCKLNKQEELPFIVLVIDELADLMMTTGKDVEEQITRIAQMARASGIHMMVATQRPSVDVITGLIKVNFPSRISFRVSSRVDSKTILDSTGAEKLLGKGDMLFMDSRSTRLQRVHGAYVSDDEINKIVEHVKSERDVEYLNLNELIASSKKDSDEVEDEIYEDVKRFVAEADEVSISLLQRKFRIGYNRSARIIDKLESQGLILPADGGKLRKVIKRD